MTDLITLKRWYTDFSMRIEPDFDKSALIAALNRAYDTWTLKSPERASICCMLTLEASANPLEMFSIECIVS